MKYKDYFYLVILLFIASCNFNFLLKPLNLVCGGTQGLSIIINKVTNIDYSIIILIINFSMFLLSSILSSEKMTLGVIISTFMYPIMVKITSNIDIFYNYYFNSILAGIISGLTSGFIYKLGFSTGGINLLGPLINKWINLKIGTINLIINVVIMILSLILFGISNFFNSIIIIVINGLVINLILYKKLIFKY